MTNSSPSNQQPSPKPNSRQLDEWVAVIVALLSIGSIFFWVMLRDNSVFSFKSPEILVSSTQPSESSQPSEIIAVKRTAEEEPESSIQLDDSPEMEKTSSLPAKVESLSEMDKSRSVSALAPLAIFGLSSTVSTTGNPTPTASLSTPVTATPETSATSETEAETAATADKTDSEASETAAKTEAETAVTADKTDSEASETAAKTEAETAATADKTDSEASETADKTDSEATEAATAATADKTDSEATETAATADKTDSEASEAATTEAETAATADKTDSEASEAAKTEAETAATADKTDSEASETAATADKTDSEASEASQTGTPPTEFSDVADDYWAKPAIDSLLTINIINGFPDGSFRPDVPVTRAELAVQLQKVFEHKAKESNIPFKDIPSDHWAASAIEEVSKSGFLRGYPGEVFRPDQQVPRVQVLVAIASGLNLELPDKPEQLLLKQYKDSADIPNYAIAKVAASTQNSLVVNYPDLILLNPNQPATRAEVSAMIYQALVVSGKVEAFSSPYIVQP